MRKNLWKAMCLAMVLACMPVPAMAADLQDQVAVAENTNESVEPRADIIYYVHAWMGQLKVHRLWNETKGVWVGPWEECDCK